MGKISAVYSEIVTKYINKYTVWAEGKTG